MAKKKQNVYEHHPYDKILKENIGELFLPLAEKQLGIHIQKSEELKDKLQTTLEREADFLRKITTKESEIFILHFEFQTQDELDMIYRMQEYHAILQKKYQLPVQQFVYYLGEAQSQMRTKLEPNEIYKGFDMRSLNEISYQSFLDSEIPEEIMLALLADYETEEAELIINKILHRFLQLKTETITLEKYLRQMLLLARLRQSLDEKLEKQINTMAFTIDIEKDRLYLKGVEKGIEEGVEKGEHRTKVKGVQRALASSKLTLEEIAAVFDVSIEFVLKVKKGEEE